MNPTLKNRDIVLVSRISQIKRGDIILFQDQYGTKTVKRVIGVPGDKINYEQGILFINDTKQDEKFRVKYKNESKMYFSLKSLMKKSYVPKKAYFVIGDNRAVSYDSRAYGFIYEQQIYGKIIFVEKKGL